MIMFRVFWGATLLHKLAEQPRNMISPQVETMGEAVPCWFMFDHFFLKKQHSGTMFPLQTSNMKGALSDSAHNSERIVSDFRPAGI